MIMKLTVLSTKKLLEINQTKTAPLVKVERAKDAVFVSKQ